MKNNQMLKLYIIGICVLFIAILANVLAGIFGLMSWYDAVVSLQKNGIAAMKQWKVIDYVWLFLLYPMILGAAGFLGMKLYEMIIK
jgi:hypothetical protein